MTIVAVAVAEYWPLTRCRRPARTANHGGEARPSGCEGWLGGNRLLLRNGRSQKYQKTLAITM